MPPALRFLCPNAPTAAVWRGRRSSGSARCWTPRSSRAAAATACEVFFAVGTSAVVYPAAGLLHEAKENRAFTVEINPDVTDASRLVDVAIAEPAEVALDAIDAMIETA